jgi:signal transduction histidine kinase
MATQTPDAPKTFHAPGGRRCTDEILRQRSDLGTLAGLAPMLDCMPDWVMILNEERQIIFGNKALRESVDGRVGPNFLGLRMGELLDCRQAALAPSGCGTGLACRYCGGVNSILRALEGKEANFECRIATSRAGAYDLRVWASPFRWQDQHHVLVVAIDESNEKRRQVLEKIFFHDLLNTASTIHGISDLLRMEPESVAELKEDLYQTADELVNEIRSQRLLLAAERNELQVSFSPENSAAIIESVVQPYRHQPLAEGKHIVVATGRPAFFFQTDKALLRRVLGNLLKNALEASKPGDTIEMGAEEKSERFVFWCSNPLPIPRAVQLQMFQRNFSTKGPGRGVGTYSVRLLTERYLGGQVSLLSAPESGTRFGLSFAKHDANGNLLAVGTAHPLPSALTAEPFPDAQTPAPQCVFQPGGAGEPPRAKS